jgi:4-hydroxy-tetrahydrodipicolinate synthase
MKPMTPEQIRGNWATLLLAWDEQGALDLPRVADEIDRILAFGVDGIYCFGSAGEFHVTEEAEFDAVARLLAEKCEAAGTPFQIGASHMSPTISLARIRRGADLAPAAFQVILPDWVPVSDEEARIFLEMAAEAAGGIGLVLYNPPHAKRVLVPAEIGRLADAVPALVGVKTGGGDDAWYDAFRREAGRLSLFVPGHSLASRVPHGADGAYSNVACLHPGGAQRWWDLIQTDPSSALDWERRIQRVLFEIVLPLAQKGHHNNCACDRFMAVLGGWADVGRRMRPPYLGIPPELADRARPLAAEILPEFFER